MLNKAHQVLLSVLNCTHELGVLLQWLLLLLKLMCDARRSY